MEEGPQTDDDARDGSEVPFVRWFYALPEPVFFPNGFTVAEKVANRPDIAPAKDDPPVWVSFRQVENSHGRAAGISEAVHLVAKASGAFPDLERDVPQGDGGEVSGRKVAYTIVDVITPFDSPESPPEDWSGEPFDLLPRSDAFMRGLRLVQDLVRGYRLTSESTPAIPSYEEIAHPILQLTGFGTVTEIESGSASVYDSPTEWSAQLMLLGHWNFPDPAPEEPLENHRLHQLLPFWMRHIRSGSPFVMWNEHLGEARKAFVEKGNYGLSVVLANTATEVLLDSVLAMLLWDEGIAAKDAVRYFERGLSVQRMSNHTAPRLGGNWGTTAKAKGPVGNWYNRAYRLRHRVVHGGYRPSRPEASAALESVSGLSTFIFDRIGEKRGTYQRTTLMTLAQPGLEQRGMWGGKIKKFAEETASEAGEWQPSFATFYKELIERRLD